MPGPKPLLDVRGPRAHCPITAASPPTTSCLGVVLACHLGHAPSNDCFKYFQVLQSCLPLGPRATLTQHTTAFCRHSDWHTHHLGCCYGSTWTVLCQMLGSVSKVFCCGVI